MRYLHGSSIVSRRRVQETIDRTTKDFRIWILAGQEAEDKLEAEWEGKKPGAVTNSATND